MNTLLRTLRESVSDEFFLVKLDNIRFSNTEVYYRQTAEFSVQDNNGNVVILKPENRLYKIENFKERISSHYYNSFFMNKLMDSGDGTYNYNNVKRWSKKFNIFRKLKVFCPINLKNTHWTMLVMYLQEKRIEYYDSMGSRGTRYLNGALQYLQDESIKVNESSFNPDEWELT